MKDRRAVGMLNPIYLCAIQNEGKNRGGEGTTPVTTACPEAGKKKYAKKKENLHRSRTIYNMPYTLRNTHIRVQHMQLANMRIDESRDAIAAGMSVEKAFSYFTKVTDTSAVTNRESLVEISSTGGRLSIWA